MGSRGKMSRPADAEAPRQVCGPPSETPAEALEDILPSPASDRDRTSSGLFPRGEGQADRNCIWGFYQTRAGQRSERLSSEILANYADAFKCGL